jgi:hypothetical protein
MLAVTLEKPLRPASEPTRTSDRRVRRLVQSKQQSEEPLPHVRVLASVSVAVCSLHFLMNSHDALRQVTKRSST